MTMCWVLSCPHSERQPCQFFAFPKDPNELKKWITNLKRTDEPGPGARICSCHFPGGVRDNGPEICTEEVKIMPTGDQLLFTENEDLEECLQADPLELPNNQCVTEWAESPLNENDFETICVSDRETTNFIKDLKNQSMSPVLRETIESIQKDNPQIETVFVDSESEEECNDGDDPVTDDSATDDAPETAEFDDTNSIEFINETDLKSLQPETDTSNSLMDPLSIKPCPESVSVVRSHYTEKDLKRVYPSKNNYRRVVQKSKISNISPFSGKLIGNNRDNKFTVTHKKCTIKEAAPLSPLLSTSLDEYESTDQKPRDINGSKYIATKVTPPPLLVQQIALKDASELLACSNILELSLNSEPNSRKKYLVIPNDVLQLFKQVNGEISINIPGVGAVCVKNPGELAPEKPTEKAKTPIKKYDPLNDPKFCCWKYRQNVKRDLEGFSYHERMGFYRAEVARAAACLNKTKLSVYQFECSLNCTEAKLNACQNSTKKVFNPHSFKVGERKNVKRIRHPIQGVKNEQDHSYSMSLNGRRKQIRKMLDLNMLKEERDQQSGIAESELLITKKVVILDEDEDTKPKRRKTSRQLEEPVKRKRGRPRKDEKIAKRKPGRPKNPFKPVEIKLEPDIKFSTRCYVDLSPEPIAKDYLNTLKDFYNDPECIKVITTLREFQSSVDVTKPILVVSRNQWNAINLEESSLTNNIVWPVNGSGEFPPWIGLTASTYNIKFVQPDILGKYLAGGRED